MDNKTPANELINNSTNKDTVAEEQISLHKWQRLSPIAILYFAASSVKQIFSNALYLIPVLAINYKSILQNPLIWLPAVAVVLGILLLFAILNYKVYRFRLSASNIEIRSGVINKKHLNLPFERVQNVKLEQPVYFRLTGHVCLQLDTAGSAKNEAKLIALDIAFAEQLKTHILDYAQNVDPTVNLSDKVEGKANSQSTAEICINSRSLSDLIIHGITSNRIWIFLGALAPFYDKIIRSVSESLENIGIDLSTLFNLQTHSIIEVTLYALSITILIMLLLVSLSVIGSIISFYGYTLNKIDDRYIRRSGLLTKHEVSMRLSRLQMIVQKQDWLDVLLKRINLTFEQNNSIQTNNVNSATNNKIIVPSIKPNECQELIDDVYPANNLAALIKQQKFCPISRRFIFRNIAFICLPIWLLVCVFVLVNNNWPLAAIITIVFLMVCGLVFLRWKRWGIATDENYVYIRKGLLGVDYFCFPLFKIQQTQFMQSLLMKKRKLASIKFVLASGALKIPLIEESFAYRLINECLFKVESSKKSWM
ncbi:PH domain-containing protein [Paraglaciecola sp. L3A3]|uniref:PH domain-containing protein n=1 Tax=Paraglaciecola sp. L3A3 TaxID=2686358 RepID=UPI00131D2079|nr:PH domain-containing protein [Paraglaciecola sp. L3A3]